jgi:hypothetical protein
LAQAKHADVGTYTVAGDTPAAIEPSPPSFQPAVEYTVADFRFALGGGDMATSILDGRQLCTEIMQSWRERGYVRSVQDVADGSFSGTADYHLTLDGRQRGETSFTMQVINALTLSLVPYTITQRYEFQYLLEDVESGAQYRATVQTPGLHCRRGPDPPRAGRRGPTPGRADDHRPRGGPAAGDRAL